MDRKEKEQAVAELHGKLKDAKLAVLAGYRGMNVEKITALRNELRKTGTEFRVVKNTLLGIAAQGTDFAGLKDNLKGPLSLSMIGGDVAAPTGSSVSTFNTPTMPILAGHSSSAQ